SRGNKYILVTIEFLSKWVEAKALPTNDARVIVKFLKSLFARFETPRAIISDRSTHFFNDQFVKIMLKYGVIHRLSTAYHPQMSGQVKVSNHGLKRILKRTVGENRASWSDKLDDALWAFRTAFKTPIRIAQSIKTPVLVVLSIVHSIFNPSLDPFIEIPSGESKDHLGKFDVKADDGYFLGYSFVSKAFRVFNTRRQQIEETYHVTFDESMEAIGLTHTSENEIGIDDSSRYPPNEFVHEGDPSRQYQVDFDISYYVIPYGRLLSELTQDNQVPKVIALNEPDIRHTEDTEAMLTRIMAAKLTAALASECIFADFLFEIEPKKVFEALKHSGWIDAMQEELNQFYRNKVWTLVPLPYGKNSLAPKGMMEHEMSMFEKLMTKKFEMIMMGELTYFLGLQIKKDDKGILICQEQYTRNLLKKYEISDSSSVKTPMVPPNSLGPGLAGKPVNETSYRRMIGSLMYLKDTSTLGMYYLKCSGFNLKGYSDSDYAGCNMDRKSTSAETEYVAAAGCCVSILWMKSQLSDYEIHYNMVPIFCDNTSAIAISNNPVLHSRTKHIDIQSFSLGNFDKYG
ncbi:retrovirus-related pol polyprotein from transposon TNT 1-94, partial [Tanacetum coccineum]